MIRAIVIAALFVVAFLVWNAPTSLLRGAVGGLQGAELINTRGTLWNGDGTLLIQGQNLGTLSWSFRPASVLALEARYEYSLSGAGVALNGELASGFSRAEGTSTGQVSNTSLNAWLAAYDLTMEGDVRLEQLSLEIGHDGAVQALDGELSWQGGEVRYPEAIGMQTALLPPLIAVLADEDGQATANVFPEGNTTPVLTARTLPGGRYRIGVTKLLTRLAGRPWRGSDPDHTVVLELEEQLL